MKRSGRRWWIVAGLGFVGVPVVIWRMAEHDYGRIAAGGMPRFTLTELHPGDGGSIEYLGVGYCVAARHQWISLHRATGVETGNLFRVGPELQYWLPGIGRDGTKFQFLPYVP